MKISLMLAVPSNIFLPCICKTLKSEEDIEIVAKALNNREIISLLKLKMPDVLFVDTAIPNLNISEILETIKQSVPPPPPGGATKLLLLLHTEGEETVIDYICLGIRGVLRDISNLEQFIRAVRAVSQEEIWVERKVLTKVVTRFQSKIKPCPKNKFTGKEGEIIKLVIEGMSNKQIAKRLFIAERTVKTHIGHIFAKVGIKHRADLTSEVVTNGRSWFPVLS